MPSQNSHTDESIEQMDVESLLAANIGDHVLLTREREELPKLLAPSERVLDVAAMALKGGRYGVLAITDRRLLHVHFGDIFRGSRITEVDYHNVRRVRPESWRSMSRIVVDLKKHQRLIHFPSRSAAFNPLRGPGSVERVEGLATCIRNAVSRVQEPVRPGRGSPPLKIIG